MRWLTTPLLLLSFFLAALLLSLAWRPWSAGRTNGLAHEQLSAQVDSGPWRRTAQGWEHISRWPAEVRPIVRRSSPPAVHPLTVALLELSGSLAALAVGGPRVRPASRSQRDVQAIHSGAASPRR